MVHSVHLRYLSQDIVWLNIWVIYLFLIVCYHLFEKLSFLYGGSSKKKINE